MTPKHPLNEPNDLELHAFLDGELPADRVAQVECRLRVDLLARVVVKAMLVQKSALLERFLIPNDCPKSRALADRVLGATDN
jgi:hypothetical protein